MADHQEIPGPVLAALQQRFPYAMNVKWEVEDDGYEAEFEFNGHEVEVEFDKDGNFRLKETAVPVEKLPEDVKAALFEAFDTEVEITEAELVETHDGRILYELDIKLEVHVESRFNVVAVGKDL